jgi:hypothetical protein
MKKIILISLVSLVLLSMSSCKERFSDGERVGTVTKFSKAGVIWDSWDGMLNITQTGMNSSGDPFEFSFDNDRSDQGALIDTMIVAQREGWKIKIKYHQVWGAKNVCNNRGESDYFVDSIEILDRNFADPLNRKAVEKAVLGSKDNPIHVVIDNKQ